MNWLMVSVTVKPEIAEAVAEVLTRSVPSGVVINPGGTTSEITVLAYLSVDDQLKARVCEIEENLGHLQQIWPVPDPLYECVPDQDWTRRWKHTVPVLHVGERIVIKPSWRDYKPRENEDLVVVEIDPGRAFGIGVHPTTQLCLRELERRIQPGMRVLDLGSGSGILSVVAVKLAGVDVWAIDHDADAVAIARKNMRLNGVADHVCLKHGSLEDVGGTFDLILANLYTSVILKMVDKGLTTHLRRGGMIIASGILEEQADEVAAAFERYDLRVEHIVHQDDWVAIMAERRL